MNGQIVIPVFYHVDPSDVRKQTGKFVDAFLELVKRFEKTPGIVRKWRAAVEKVSCLSGFISTWDESESRLVEDIVEEILSKLKHMSPSSHFEGLVGLNSRMERVISLLHMESQDVQKVGIWGMRGIGKTTIARTVFNQISDQFDGKCFMASVREEAKKLGGLLHLQEQILSIMLEEKINKVDPKFGLHRRQSMLSIIDLGHHLRPSFIVLDDVDVNTFEQLKFLAETYRFGRGSRIIVTSRDKNILKNFAVDYIYEVEGFNPDEALELFCKYAFKSNAYPHEFRMLSLNVVDYAQGNPLALKLLGSFLWGKSKQDWEIIIHNLKRLPDLNIDDALKLSFDELHQEDENLFLDIACFFKGVDRDEGQEILRRVKKKKETDSTEVKFNSAKGKFLDMSKRKNIHKLEHKSTSKSDKLVSLFDVECDRLDFHAKALWHNMHLKQLLLKLDEVHYLLQNSELSDQNLVLNNSFTDLRGLAYDIDELIDDWEQSEISKSKFDQEVRRIHGQLVQLLNLFHKVLTGDDEQRSAFSETSSRRSDEYPVSERDLERSVNGIKFLLLRNVDMVRIIPIDTGRIGETVLTQRIYTDEKVKSHFPFRFWFSVGKNVDLSTILKVISVQCSEILIAEKKVDYGDVFCERLLIVLEDVSDVDDEKLENFRILILNMLNPGSCVLVTTPYRRVATLLSLVPTLLSLVPEEHLQCLPEVDSQAHYEMLGAAHNPLLENEESLRLIAPESIVMTEPQRHSTAGCKVETTAVLPGLIKVLSETVSTSEIKLISAADENPASNPKKLTEDDRRCPPATDMLASETQVTPHVPGTIEVISDGKKNSLPLGEKKSKAEPFQNKEKGQTSPILDACAEQPVEPAVLRAAGSSRSNVTAENSIKRNVQKIFRYMNDVTVSKIGVHGIGGIGKTAVLSELIKQTESMFQVIILVTVSRHWNKRKIQNEVSRQLSLSLEDYETDSQFREKILHDLNRKKFLLLLDDVWEQIDLEAVGIPVPSSENRCKIIMASRKLDVCQKMNVHKVIELETLSRKEGWELFSKQVGRTVHLPNIQPFAESIVEGCCGLPLPIIVTGKALIGENDISVWEHASRKFSLASPARVYHTEDVIQLLKFSFDQLKDHDIKSCFVHCGLFPEDREVNISELIEYCIQEGVICGSRADAHKRGYDMVDVLEQASLLQVTEDGDYIKMHGLIRDLALGILSSAVEDGQYLLRTEGSQFLLRAAYSRLTESSNIGGSTSCTLTSPESGRLFIPEAHHFFLGAGVGISELPLGKWEQAKMIFLMDNKLCTLPPRPSCPNLLTLFVQRNSQLRAIPPSFFDLMTSLKMVNLSKTRIKSLPNTIVKLQQLQILILRDCELLVMLPSEVGSLKCLEVLDLQGTEIDELPDEIGKLESLMYLEVFFYGSIDKSEHAKLPPKLISSGTISRLHALETLSIVVYPGDKRWYQDVKSVATEVSNLTKLSSLSFHFPQVEHVKEFLEGSVAWKDKRLAKFKFVVGRDVKSITSRVPGYVQFDYNQQAKCLRFVNGEKISSEVLQILARSTAFYLDHHLHVNSLSDFEVSNINDLKFCIVSECPKIETIVDIKEHATSILPSLETLSIHHLWNLTCIWKGLVPAGSFAELRIFSVHACPELKSIFTTSMIRFLAKLEELTVENCPAIESIILEEDILDSSCIILPSLKKLRLHYLPGLVNIWRNAWPSLEYISIYDCPQLKNGMDSKLKVTLIEIKAEKEWWDALEWEDSELRRHLEDRLTEFSEDDIYI